jgi:hypothetical protein
MSSRRRVSVRPRPIIFRVKCPAVRYAEQGEEWDIDDCLCRQHGSIEFQGACGEAHLKQCEKVGNLACEMI